jgi:hypothetical protein
MSDWLYALPVAVAGIAVVYGFLRGRAFRKMPPPFTIDPARYIQDPAATGFGFEVRHLDGIDWYDAPPPPVRHTCWAQTKGWVDLREIFRCACGAASYDGRYWMERNQRNSSTSTGGGWLGATIPRGCARPSPGQDSEARGAVTPTVEEGHPSGPRGLEPAGEAQAGGFQEPPPPTPPR